ncbi:hypothetical protein K1W69_17145 [Hoeflea sp. WL0058]|uniref:Capsular biosynthesis protein n=1 Tax=Flavimaribacter sediminis TaxID=2865987 RepID=A0AAE2ZQB4_9HYPH|nr:hypothetical protein [Flavimaribacter sediminis]MBW8638926.1 hypothetical protein [Flavimaribacter sediminis]
MQKNPAEKLVFATIASTWLFYLIGGLYVVGPVIGWLLAGLAGLSLYLGNAIRADLRPTGSPPPLVLGWIAGMVAMLVPLLIAHAGWDLGMGQTIKSVVGWAKGWALVALFIFAGATLPIRRSVIVRAMCVVALITVVLTPLFIVAPMAGLPSMIFVSPLKAIGGPGPEYFSVYLYTIDPASGSARWQFFAPWSPFAGLIGVLTVAFALDERQRFWMLVGVLGGLTMILLSMSRMSLVALPVSIALPRLLPLASRPFAWFLAAALMGLMTVFGSALFRMIQQAVDAFRGARAASSEVRSTLQRIAYERWSTEAVWFGHGTVQPGPHLVEYMPIGSHHTWYGLLFVKGVAGLLAFAIPLVWQTAAVVHDCLFHSRGRLPLSITLVMIMLTFGENIEIEAYLIWPSFMVLGVHARQIARDRLSAAEALSAPQGLTAAS